MGIRLRTLLAALALVAGTALGFAAPASAATITGTCTGGILCGKVTNLSTSKAGIIVSNGWDPYASGVSWARLAPGQSSPYKDTDGFYVPSGYKAYSKGYSPFSAGWHKINDTMTLALYVYRG